MNVAQRYSIAYKGLKNGSHTFDFKVDASLFEAFDSEYIRGGSCAVKIDVMRSETMLELLVSIVGDVSVECDRCLELCDVPIDFNGQLLVKFSDEIRDYDGDVMWLSPAENHVELAQYIYESIVLSLPYKRVHPDGACNPDMLERFRLISAEEFEAIEADALKEQSEGDEWSKLAALKAKMELENSDKNK